MIISPLQVGKLRHAAVNWPLPLQMAAKTACGTKGSFPNPRYIQHTQSSASLCFQLNMDKPRFSLVFSSQPSTEQQSGNRVQPLLSSWSFIGKSSCILLRRMVFSLPKPSLFISRHRINLLVTLFYIFLRNSVPFFPFSFDFPGFREQDL